MKNKKLVKPILIFALHNCKSKVVLTTHKKKNKADSISGIRELMQCCVNSLLRLTLKSKLVLEHSHMCLFRTREHVPIRYSYGVEKSSCE